MYSEPVKREAISIPSALKYPVLPRPACSVRLEELAKPKKRLVSHVWAMYSYLFTPERREAIRMLLQELYAMTPEETALYFDTMTGVLKKIEARRRMRKRLAARYQQKVKKAQRKKAFRKFEMLLRQAMKDANEKPVLPLVSPRLRNISQVILQQLCELLGISVPDRSDTNEQAQFVMNVADWFAVKIENIYYEIQVHKNREFNDIEEEIKKAKETGIENEKV